MIKVLKPGFYSSIQDFGRVDFQNFGVPISGVMDSYASNIANALLGNDSKASVLEITMTGPTLQFNCDTLICISGADMSSYLNNTSIPNNQVIQIHKDDILSFGKLKRGFRSYLAVSEGFKTQRVMGSFSMYKGITNQISINKNDTLEINSIHKATVKSNAALRVQTGYINKTQIEVFKGPEFDLLSVKQKHKLLNSEFTISKNNNRMAYQLEELFENNLNAIITSPVLPGTVQLTPLGNLIILMRDCQTTGGYPRVLQLKKRSINVLAQKYTGKTVTFQLIDIK